MTQPALTGDTTTVAFFVAGNPVAQGSKRIGRHGRHPVILDNNDKQLGPWRERVAIVAHNAMLDAGLPIYTGAVSVCLSFVLPRPKSAPKRSTPPAAKRPDIDKLIRAILDAITDVVVHDDALVVNLHAYKRLAEIGETPGVEIRVEVDQ